MPNCIIWRFCSDFHRSLSHHAWKFLTGTNKVKASHLKTLQWYFVTKIVLNLLWEKIVLVNEQKFWNLRLKAENLRKFWDHLNNLKVRTIFGNTMFFSNLFLGLSQIWWIRKIRIHYIWETFRNKLKSIMLPKILLTFYCLNKLFLWSQKFCKFSAFSLEFQKFFSITKQCFLTVGQNNFGNKIPFIAIALKKWVRQISKPSCSFMYNHLSKFLWANWGTVLLN